MLTSIERLRGMADKFQMNFINQQHDGFSYNKKAEFLNKSSRLIHILAVSETLSETDSKIYKDFNENVNLRNQLGGSKNEE